MIFRRTDKYGYSRYYGGGGPAFVIKVVVTILLMVALVIGAAAFVVQKYMVYTENGGHLELPWAKSSSQTAPEEPDGGLEGLVIEDKSGSESSAEASQSAETSAEASQSAEASAEASQSAEASAEASESAEASAEASQSAEASAEASQSAEASAEASQSADTSTPAQSAQPGLWERFMAWLKSIFQPAQTTAPVTPADSSAASAPEPAASSQAGQEEQSQTEASSQGEASSQAEESAAQSQQEKPVSSKEALSGGLLIQHVSIGDVKGGYAEGDVKNKKGNGIMLFMKESGGKLNFSSNQGLAQELGVNGEESTGDKIKEVVSELKGKDYYTLAYVNCFQDQKAGTESDLRLYDNDNDAWVDGEDRTWADPTNVRYQNYLVALIRELDAIGFDEIVLSNACYPATGKTSRLSAECYDPDTFQDTVSGFYKKLSQELKDCKCMVSLVTTEKAIQDGYDEATGQSLEAMLQLGGRLWVDADRDKAEALSQALKQAGYPDNALGVLVGSLKDSDDFNQMNVD